MVYDISLKGKFTGVNLGRNMAYFAREIYELKGHFGYESETLFHARIRGKKKALENFLQWVESSAKEFRIQEIEVRKRRWFHKFGLKPPVISSLDFELQST